MKISVITFRYRATQKNYFYTEEKELFFWGSAKELSLHAAFIPHIAPLSALDVLYMFSD